MEYQDMLSSTAGLYGMASSELEDIMDRIAFHESAQTMEPTTEQYGGGPGRGLTAKNAIYG
jgi:hypothetical protein